jgi:riboflavin kinase / FMN adenylyltransferase
VQIFRDVTSAIASANRTIVTIGAYDGVHLGHQAVIAEVRRLAVERGLDSAVVTFDRHPASVVRPESAPKLICDAAQKLELLAATGVDAVWQVVFDTNRASESAEEFVRSVLVDKLRAAVVVVGDDFHFGKGRRGNVELLKQMGAEHDFEVIGLELIGSGAGESTSAKVSSTEIRRLIAAGSLREASALLGHHHELRGTVVHGDARGRTLGFPTANVAISDGMCLPADGIYACWYRRPDGVRLPAAVNFGRRPMFYDAQPYSLLEAFVLDFNGNLYDEPARVEFVERLRAEAKFDSLDALITQMNADVARARTILAAEPAA